MWRADDQLFEVSVVKVLVYNFKVYDVINDQYIVPPRKRQMHDIKSPPINGQPIMESAESVEPSELDEFGRYDPRGPGDAKK